VEKVSRLRSRSHQLLVILAILVTGLAIVFVAQRIIVNQLNSAQDDVGRQVDFVIEVDETINSVAERLHEDGLIRSPAYFRFRVRFTGEDQDIVAGRHQLNTAMTTNEIIAAITSEDAISIQETTVTFLEGWRSEEFAAELVDAGLIGSVDEFMQAASDPRWNNEFDFLHTRPSAVGLEGYLFPDTYNFRTDATPEEIIEILLQTFEARVPPEQRLSAESLGLTFHQAITLASIVEREAAVAEERPVVASVYYNRLIAVMPLQADPTVQYALGTPADWWPVLTEGQLEEGGRYNTYLNPNLPPGPICNPSLASIQAALEPAQTDYLFFVAKGDGTHAFASTFEEHEENVLIYQGASQ
jgi:UPF0755 protein